MITVRVATTNNFNCTEAEWIQLNTFVQANPDKYFFINSNIKTPALLTINDHPYKAVITANPNLNPEPGLADRLSRLAPDKIAFIRVKWLPERQDIQRLIKKLARKYSVVITVQRFNGKKSLFQYSTRDHYKWSRNRFRLFGDSLKTLEKFVRNTPNVRICDKKGLGCQGCGLCSKLTVGKVYEIKSLNMSSSGICPHDCQDCYAKTMQRFCTGCGYKAIDFDRIQANAKQKGKTRHIQEARANENRHGHYQKAA